MSLSFLSHATSTQSRVKQVEQDILKNVLILGTNFPGPIASNFFPCIDIQGLLTLPGC